MGHGLSVLQRCSKNHIIEQNPIPDSKIKENREVKIVLSKGKKVELIEIPDLQNMSLNEAISLIEENGLILGRVTVTVPEAFSTMYLS